MSDAPAASVVIPVLNGEATLGELLTSLKNQAGVPGPIEIMVVDNGSTDRTAEIARAPAPPVASADSRPVRSAQPGTARARAEVVVFTDSDTIPSRRWLASCWPPLPIRSLIATGPIFGWQPATGAERYSQRAKLLPAKTPPNIRFILSPTE